MSESDNFSEHKDEKKLQLCMAEFEFVWTQMHQRMSGVSNLISLSAAFFAFAVGFVISNDNNTNLDYELLITTSFTIPFFVIGSLIAREDFFMLSHDAYIIEILRPRMLKLSGSENDHDLLTFIYSMDKLKTSNFSTFLGIARYLFAILGLLFVLVMIWNNGPTPASGTWWACFVCTVALVFALLLMMFSIKQIADRNYAQRKS